MTPPLTMPAETGSTLIQHYAEVRARLYGPRPIVRIRRLIPAVEPVASPDAPKPRARDFIFIKPRAAGVVRPSMGGMWNIIAAETIIQETAAKHQVTSGQIKGQCRTQDVVSARFEVFHRLNTELGYSMPMIGKTIGGRDHSGVLHGLRKYRAKLEAAGL